MIQKIEVETDLWYAKRLSGNTGWTWTLASRLGDILHTAEELYGPRDHRYTILGVEFGDDTPRIWYPGNRKHVVVQITPECTTDVRHACFQMAHEAIHLLSPSGGKGTTVLDEGLATHFSIAYTRKIFGSSLSYDVLSYVEAGALAGRLLAIDPDIIRSIRAHQPSLFAVTAGDIQAAHPDVPEDLARALAQPFVR